MRLPGILPHCSALRPCASIENSAAGTASTLKPKSNASAAASKAGPKFAEVAGRNMRKSVANESRRSAISRVLRFERPQDRVSIGIQNDRRLSLLRRHCAERVVFHARNREIAAMKLDGVLRVLQHVSSQHQHHRVAVPHETTLHEFLEPSQRDC